MLKNAKKRKKMPEKVDITHLSGIKRDKERGKCWKKFFGEFVNFSYDMT